MKIPSEYSNKELANLLKNAAGNLSVKWQYNLEMEDPDFRVQEVPDPAYFVFLLEEAAKRLIEPIKELIPTYGLRIDLYDFIQSCKLWSYMDGDGLGYYATATHMSNEHANPSEIRVGKIDYNFTHVVWFNK
jgi:hypothetical protein